MLSDLDDHLNDVSKEAFIDELGKSGITITDQPRIVIEGSEDEAAVEELMAQKIRKLKAHFETKELSGEQINELFKNLLSEKNR